MVLMTLRFWLSSETISLVKSICATVWLYSLNILSYIYINSHWPTAAHACREGISCGFSFKPRQPTPTPIAPDETRITSLPEFLRSARTFTSFSILRMLKRPDSWVRAEVPTLTTIRFASLKQDTSNTSLIYKFIHLPL